MMLEPAQCAGDAPRNASEQGTSVEPPLPAEKFCPENPSTHGAAPHPCGAVPTRLAAPSPDTLARAARDTWLKRRSLERQLHDGAALRISALTLQLGLLRHRASEPGADLQEAIEALQEEMHAVLQELREVAGRIYPPLLDVAGLGAALREAAARVEGPACIDVPEDRFDPATEAAAYFAVSVCLDTLGSALAPVRVTVRRNDAVLVVEVADVAAGNVGIVGEKMQMEICSVGGAIDVAVGPDAGTITARIPCE
jgi:signal transduction histidine kinase